MVDFAGGDLDWLRPGQPVDAHVATSSGKVSAIRVEPLGENRGWRLVFDLEPDGKKPADLRAHLRLVCLRCLGRHPLPRPSRRRD